MRIRFWGTRGSVPAPGGHSVRHGGNTPCVEVRGASGELLILDAGTGIRELGRSLGVRANGDAIVGDIVISHAHWDHIQGLPFFAPLFDGANRFTIWSADDLGATVQRAIRDQMATGVFPVDFAALPSTVKFRTLTDGRAQEIAGLSVTTIAVRHPGGSLGYRISDETGDGAALVYISDNELGESPQYESAAEWRAELVRFASGARVLVHDATYTNDEYERHRGWGHSSIDDVIALARDARVQRLVLFHHKPERADDDLDALVARCRAESGLDVIAAAEGMEIEV